MNLGECVIEGLLKPYGTLELELEKPSLVPGRVQVTVKPLVQLSTGRRLVEVMDEIRQSQRARGYQGRTIQEMQSEERTHQQEDQEYDRRCQQLWGGPSGQTHQNQPRQSSHIGEIRRLALPLGFRHAYNAAL